MKELSIEEKAKRYDDLLVKLHEAKVDDNVCDERYCCVIDNIVPELKESEDGRIINNIKKVIGWYRGMFTEKSLMPEEYQEINAWLEKQGENISLPKFTFDDVLALQCCMETVKKVQEDKELYEQLQSLHDRLHDAYWLKKQGEPVEINPIEFDTRLQALIGKFDSLPKEELIGSLSFWMNVVQNDGTYKSDEKQGEQKSAWSEEDKEMLDGIIVDVEVLKEQDRTKDGKAAYQKEIDWLKSIEDKVQPQPKQEWNEDTQQWIDAIIFDYEFWYDEDKDHRTTIQAKINILKSLKERYTWKPSDRQMQQLGWIAEQNEHNLIGKELMTLYKDLKKLRKE